MIHKLKVKKIKRGEKIENTYNATISTYNYIMRQ